MLEEHEHSLCGPRKTATLDLVSFMRDRSRSFLLDTDRVLALFRCFTYVSFILSVTEFLPPPTISEVEWTKGGQCPARGEVLIQDSCVACVFSCSVVPDSLRPYGL